MSTPESDPIQKEQLKRDTAVSPPSSYTYSYYSPPQPKGLQAYKPFAYQIERADKNKRSTRWHWVPVALAGILTILFSLFLLYEAIWPSTPNARAFISGMADFTSIMFMLPLILIFLLVQIGMIGAGVYVIQWKRTMPDSPVKKYGYVRVMLWQLEFWLEKGRPYIDKASNKASAIVISYNQKIAVIEFWLTTLKKWIIRS